MSSPVAIGVSPSRATPSRYIRSLKFSRVSELLSSAVLPSRKTIMLSGSPLLERVRSIPRASAITIKKTVTVKPIVKAVASVLPFRTTMLRMLYLSGSAILFSAPQSFGDCQARDSISGINHADQSHQNRQPKRCHQRLGSGNKFDEKGNVQSQIYSVENQHRGANSNRSADTRNDQSLAQKQRRYRAALKTDGFQRTHFLRPLANCHRHRVAHDEQQ